MALYVGMDYTAYPGRALMNDFLNKTNIVWTGLYLDSPRPVVGEKPSPKSLNGHNRYGGTDPQHPKGSWMKAMPDLRELLVGVLPIYWGQQDLRNNQGPCDLRDTIAQANAHDASEKAQDAGLESGAVIYLDWEFGGIANDGLKYCVTWFSVLADLGYRPGVYCHPPVAEKLQEQWPNLYIWIVRPQNYTSPTATEKVFASHTAISASFQAPDLKGARYARAVAWQWAYVKPPQPKPPYTNPWPVWFRTLIPGVPIGLDINVSAVGDPSFPEDRVQPTEVGAGHATALPYDKDHAHVLAVRHGAISQQIWSLPGTDNKNSIAIPRNDSVVFHPWVTPRAIARVSNNVKLTSVITIGRSSAPDAPEGVWAVYENELSANSWDLRLALPYESVPADPLAGLAVISRDANTFDLVVVSRADGLIYVTSRTEPQKAWSAPVPMDATFRPHRLSGLAAVSRDTGIADIFMVDSIRRRLFTSNSTHGHQWTAPFPIGNDRIATHPMSNIAAVSREPSSIDVFVIGKDETNANADWLLYDVWWRQSDGWLEGGSGLPHMQPIGGFAVHPHPLSRIGVVSRASNVIDVFVVGRDNGLLYNTWWDQTQNQWAPFRQVGGSTITITTVDAALALSADTIAVIATGRDGKIYATYWTSTSTAYSELEEISLEPARHTNLLDLLNSLKQTLEQHASELSTAYDALAKLLPQIDDPIDTQIALLNAVKASNPSGDIPMLVDAINEDLTNLKQS